MPPQDAFSWHFQSSISRERTKCIGLEVRTTEKNCLTDKVRKKKTVKEGLNFEIPPKLLSISEANCLD